MYSDKAGIWGCKKEEDAEVHPASDFSELLCCPFCGDTDFDLVGLKGHLEHGDCKPYNELETRRRMF